MGFEYDPGKSRANKLKHGIDFEEAQSLWFDPQRVEFTARFQDEERKGLIGSWNGKVWWPYSPKDQIVKESFQSGEHAIMKKPSTVKAEEFDKKFDEGEDISAFVDPSSIHRPGTEPRRVNVDFPDWVIQGLDRQSKRIGVSRQALIKLWISERLQTEEKK